MIRAVSNIPEIQKKFNQTVNSMNRIQVKSIKGAALAGQRFARRIAPVKTGDLKSGVRRTPIIRKGNITSTQIISSVKKPFPYHFWVNETKGYKTVTLPTVYFANIRKWPKRKTRLKYGLNQRRTYHSTKHTGVPGYFSLTAGYLKQMFPQYTVKILNGELRKVWV